MVHQSNTTPGWPISPSAQRVPEDLSGGRLQQRSQSFDDGFGMYEKRIPFRQKSHSFDILDTEGSHLATSPEQIRELLNISRNNTDMPARTPPPIPKRLSNTQSGHTGAMALDTETRLRRDRAQDYEFMKPQTSLTINLAPGHDQHDSDSGVESPLQDGGHTEDLHSDPTQTSHDLSMRYMRMGSQSAIRHDIDLGDGKFTRSQSARTIQWTQKLDGMPAPPEHHRWEDVTTVARSKFKGDGKRPTRSRTLDKYSRKSRSVDDLLAEGGLEEAESLRDVLARTYVPPAGKRNRFIWIVVGK